MNLILPTIHNITNYSLLNSSLSIQNLIDRALTNKHPYVVISDKKYMYGYLDFYHQCIKNKLRPIFGLTITYHQSELLLIAKNQIGYENLVKFSSHEKIVDDWFNDLFVIVLDGDIDLCNENVYYANQNNEKGIYVRECRFELETDFEVFCSLIAIANQTKLEDEILHQSHFSKAYLNQIDLVNENDITVRNLFHVLNSCEQYEPTKQVSILKFLCPEGIDANQYLTSLAMHGLFNVRFQEQKKIKNFVTEYKNRLEYELEVIKKMNFADYFLIVQDYISYARSQSIMVGPGRGSIAGSLVAYSLGITNVDPIKYELYFERFLNPDRKTMPDIDVDFMDTKRELVINYLYEKYGNDRVAQVITFQKIKARGSIRDVGRILEIDLKKIDYICKQIPHDHNGDLFSLINDPILEKEIKAYPKLFTLANKIIGFPRQIGIHAAGLVLSNKILGNDFPISINSNGNYIVTQYSMEYLEELGLLKMDLLGLRNLTTIQEVINLIYQNHNKEIEIEAIDFNDSKVYQELSEGNTSGIFQLESPGMTNLTKKIKPQNLEDISLISALYRPGPQKHIGSFLKCRNKEIAFQSLNSRIDDLLIPTHGIIVYQEQLIAVVVRVMNCSLAQADIFRRTISKKDEKGLHNLWTTFLEYGLKNKFTKQELEKIWTYIYEFARYGFNHSHSISYAMISYWLAWLKKYYKLEFYCVLLSSFSKTTEYISEANQVGIECLAPNINYSASDFQIHNKKIYFGLKAIDGLGDETIKKIINAKKKWGFKPFTDLKDTLGFLFQEGVTANALTILNRAGCFDELFTLDQNRYFVDVNLKKIIDSRFDLSKTGAPLFDIKYEHVNFDEAKKSEYYVYQQDLLDYSFVEHKVKKIKSLTRFQTTVSQIESQTQLLDEYLVVIEEFRSAKRKSGQRMDWIKISDETGISKSYPYFGTDHHFFETLCKSKAICIITIKNKNQRFHISSIKPFEKIKNE